MIFTSFMPIPPASNPRGPAINAPAAALPTLKPFFPACKEVEPHLGHFAVGVLELDETIGAVLGSEVVGVDTGLGIVLGTGSGIVKKCAVKEYPKSWIGRSQAAG